eukprot:g6859.t1
MEASSPLMFTPPIFDGGIEPIPLHGAGSPVEDLSTCSELVLCVKGAFDGVSGHDDGHPLRQQHAEAADPVEATRVHLITLLDKMGAKKAMAMKMLEIIDGTTAVEPGSAGRGGSPIGGGGPASPLDVDASPTLTAVAPINADVVTPTNAAAGHDELISKFAATPRVWISTAVVHSVHDLVSPAAAAAAAAATTDAISASDEPISTFNPTPRAGVSTPVGSSVLDLVSPAVTADAAPAAGSLVAAEPSTTIKVAHKNHSGAPVLAMKKSPTTSTTTPARRAPFTAAAYVTPISRTVAPPSTPSFLHTKTPRTPSSSGSVNMGKKPPPMRFGGAGEAMSSPPRTLPGGNTPRKASIDAGAAPTEPLRSSPIHTVSAAVATESAAAAAAAAYRARGSASTGAVEHTREQAGGGVDDASGDERHRQGERTPRTAQSPDLLHGRGSKTLTNVRELLDAKTAVEEDNAKAAKEGAAKAAVAKAQEDAAKAARDVRASNRAALKYKHVAGTRASGSRLEREDHELFEARHSDLDTTTEVRSTRTLRSNKASSRTAAGTSETSGRPRWK